MKHYILPLFLITLSFFYSQAQNPLIDGSRFVNQIKARNVTEINKDINAKGSAYINDVFLPIKVLNQKENNLFLARYNAYNGDMEIKDVDSNSDITRALLIDTNDFIIEFMKDGKTYQSYNYIDENNNQKRDFFVNLVSTNRVSLLKKETVVFKEEVIAKSSYDKNKPAEFKRLSDTYYLKIGTDNAIEVPSNKKELAGLFPKHEGDIKTFIKKNRIKTSKEEDLIQLVDYINTL
ncbi:MAG: hypothetical protein GYB32_12895 [Algicola sp.]|nr:hypothetical protein [Algicola sp.]